MNTAQKRNLRRPRLHPLGLATVRHWLTLTTDDIRRRLGIQHQTRARPHRSCPFSTPSVTILPGGGKLP